jgi:predicted nuclease of predicted toxin-antitoxin system
MQADSDDTDLGTLLVVGKEARPSVILVRHGSRRRPDNQAALLKGNLPQLDQVLQAGSIVMISPDRILVRSFSP